jgi:HK97 family phage portal protein
MNTTKPSRPSIGNRIQAAFNAFTGRVPQGNAIQDPYFFHYSSSVMGTPTQAHAINYPQLRAFSETPIPRRAIDYIRTQVTRLEWDILIKHGKKATSEQRKRIEIAKNVLRNPNASDNWTSFIGQIIEDMLVIGMGTSEVKDWKTNKEMPYILYPVDAASVQIYMDWDGNPNTRRYAQVDLHGRAVDFTPKELLVFTHNPRTNTPFGLAPLEVAVQQITYLLDAQSYAGKTASNATPKKLLYLGQEVTEDQVREFRRYFRDEIEGRSHIPIIGGTDDVKSVELGLATDHALFLQWQAFLIAIIANAFGLDAMKFNAFVGINRSTGDALDDTSDESAIRPMAHQIEHYINQFLLSLFGISDIAEFKFRFTTSFQDRKSLSVIHQIYAQIDVLTINEIRREIGLPDLPKDDLLGYSKGELTLSEYRGIFGASVTLQDAVGIDHDTKTPGAQAIEQARGNNGVNGMPNTKETNVHQRTDHATDVSM